MRYCNNCKELLNPLYSLKIDDPETPRSHHSSPGKAWNNCLSFPLLSVIASEDSWPRMVGGWLSIVRFSANHHFISYSAPVGIQLDGTSVGPQIFSILCIIYWNKSKATCTEKMDVVGWKGGSVRSKQVVRKKGNGGNLHSIWKVIEISLSWICRFNDLATFKLLKALLSLYYN